MRPPLIAPIGLVVGAVFGMAGSFMPTEALRALAWGIDGVALVLAGAFLLVHHLRLGHDTVAAGFAVFIAGQTLVLSSAAMPLDAMRAPFAAGAALWAAALAVISAPAVFPVWVRGVGVVAALLFAITALEIFSGVPLTPISEPLPTFAYPLLVLTMFGWAWTCLRRP